MKHITFVIMLFLILTCCAKQKIYQSKGVSYFEKPVNELDAFYTFTNPPGANPELPNIPVSGNPLSIGNTIYFPIETSYTVNKKRHAYSTIYACDATSNAITDSLVIKTENVRQTFRRLVYDKDIFIIGTSDSLCHVYRADTNLKIKADYPTEIKTNSIVNAALKDGMLQLIVTNTAKELYSYDLNLDTMQPVRKRLLLKSYDKSGLDGNKLWYFTANDSVLFTAQIDLSASDPSPVFKSFNIKIPLKGKYRHYNIKVIDTTLYLSYSWFTDDAVGAAKLVRLNYTDGTQQSKEYAGVFSFDVIANNGKNYIFRTSYENDKNAFIVAELNPDLSETNRMICFFLAEYESVRGIIPYKDNKFFLMGSFEKKTGKKYVSELPGIPKLKMEEMVPQSFCAVFTIK